MSLNLALCRLLGTLRVLGFCKDFFKKFPFFNIIKGMLRTFVLVQSQCRQVPGSFYISVASQGQQLLLGVDVNQLPQNEGIQCFSFLRFYIILNWIGLFTYHCTGCSARILYLSKNHFYCNEDTALCISLFFLLFLLCLLAHKSPNKDKTFHRKYLPSSIILL